MKKYKIVLIVFLFAQMLESCGVFAKSPKIRNLPVLAVVNNTITEILDSLITSDKIQEYYSDSLIYCITIRKLPDSFLFSFTSTRLLGFLNTEQGVLKFKNHLVVVCSGNYESIESFFSKTNSDYVIRFHEFNNRITPKGEVILELIEDDSHITWGFVYKNNKFIINGEDQKIWGE